MEPFYYPIWLLLETPPQKRKTMKTLISILFLLSNFNWLMAQHHTLYLIPGTGGDHRLFKNLQIENCETSHIELWLFEKGETLPEYAQRLSAQIDTTQPYSIAGVSLGGMVGIPHGR
ncbi:MAG: hypothetical protein COA57_02860 [Flavobacteriales bacterium]|nr:MAG: hypothetical protein COA57_02860 [Flavobacteriales bacterium]